MDILKDYPVKWINSDKFHLTLRFLGNTEKSEVAGLTAGLNKIKPGFNKPNFQISDIGFCPDRKYPNVVFIGLKESGNNSAKVIEMIDDIIIPLGIKPDKKFVPHITLGRFKHDGRRKVSDKVNIETWNFEIEFQSFFLMKSFLKSGGPEYEVIKEFKLQ